MTPAPEDIVLAAVTPEWACVGELANELGWSRALVYRLLKAWQRRGRVEFQLHRWPNGSRSWRVRIPAVAP